MSKLPRRTDEFDWIPAVVQELSAGAQPLAPQRVEVELESGGSVSAIRWGADASEVVYLHGSGQNAHTWDLVATLVGAPALAIDLPGHGHSSWRADRDYRPATNARAITDALGAFGMHPKVVVGMSLGGLTALALADRAPDLVQDLLLVDILPQLEERRITYDRSKLGSVALLDGPREFDTLAEMEEAAIAATGGTRAQEPLKRGVWHNAIQLPNGRWRWRYDDLSASRTFDNSGLWDALGRLSAPVTLVKGALSPLLTPELVEQYRAVRPNGRMVTVPGVGHAVQSEAPELLADLIRTQVVREQPYSGPAV